jgi:hypothetical protein
MGSSCPVYGSDSRQDGKKFPGCLNENARPSLFLSDGLFVLVWELHENSFWYFLFNILLFTAYIFVLFRHAVGKMLNKARHNATS